MNTLGNSTSPLFQGKSHNKHPHWRNVPLRLNEAQIEEPRLVIEDFFQCYHLNDIREILWKWVVEVLISKNSISNESVKRDHHIYFYEKIEELVEAAYIINNRTEDTELNIRHDSENSSKLSDSNEVQPSPSQNKEKRLIEIAEENPFTAIKLIYEHQSLPMLNENLQCWYNMSIANDNSNYAEGKQREQLIDFYDSIKLLIEVLFVINIKEKGSKTLKPWELEYLVREAVPSDYIIAFFDKYAISYIQQLLDEWLSAGVGYKGNLSEDHILSGLEVLETCQDLNVLIKSAYMFYKKDDVPHMEEKQ